MTPNVLTANICTYMFVSTKNDKKKTDYGVSIEKRLFCTKKYKLICTTLLVVVLFVSIDTLCLYCVIVLTLIEMPKVNVNVQEYV